MKITENCISGDFTYAVPLNLINAKSIEYNKPTFAKLKENKMGNEKVNILFYVCHAEKKRKL